MTGDTLTPDVTMQVINVVLVIGLKGPCIPRGRIPGACAIPELRNNSKCEYRFIFLKINSACNELAH